MAASNGKPSIKLLSQKLLYKLYSTLYESMLQVSTLLAITSLNMCPRQVEPLSTSRARATNAVNGQSKRKKKCF